MFAILWEFGPIDSYVLCAHIVPRGEVVGNDGSLGVVDCQSRPPVKLVQPTHLLFEPCIGVGKEHAIVDECKCARHYSAFMLVTHPRPVDVPEHRVDD